MRATRPLRRLVCWHVDSAVSARRYDVSCCDVFWTAWPARLPCCCPATAATAVAEGRLEVAPSLHLVLPAVLAGWLCYPPLTWPAWTPHNAGPHQQGYWAACRACLALAGTAAQSGEWPARQPLRHTLGCERNMCAPAHRACRRLLPRCWVAAPPHPLAPLGACGAASGRRHEAAFAVGGMIQPRCCAVVCAAPSDRPATPAAIAVRWRHLGWLNVAIRPCWRPPENPWLSKGRCRREARARLQHRGRMPVCWVMPRPPAGPRRPPRCGASARGQLPMYKRTPRTAEDGQGDRRSFDKLKTALFRPIPTLEARDSEMALEVSWLAAVAWEGVCRLAVAVS